MKCALWISLAFVLGAVLAAETQAPPIPTALRNAATVYVVNKGVPNRVFENTIKALTQWKRWTLAADAKDADLTLTVSAQPTKQFYNWATNSSMTINSQFLEITAPDGTALYGATFVGNPDKELKKLAKRLE